MCKYMTRYVVTFDQTFTYVDDEILKWMIQNRVQSTLIKIDMFTLWFDIVRNFELIKLKIMKELLNFNDIIFITFNLWTACNQDIVYIYALVHYINYDWQLCKKIIIFKVLKYHHSSITIYQTLINIFNEYRINNFIFIITFFLMPKVIKK